MQNGLGTPGWEGFEELEEILSNLHCWVPQEAAGHVLGSLGEQERWGGTTAGQALGEAHLGNRCLGAVYLLW